MGALRGAREAVRFDRATQGEDAGPTAIPKTSEMPDVTFRVCFYTRNMATPRKILGARVLVTGAASGLGALLAVEMALRGASQVLLWDLDAAGLARVQHQLELLKCPVRSYRVDLAEPESVEAAAERTLADAGGIDICINSAGVVSGREFWQLSEDDIRRTFEVNSLALFRTTRVVLPGMVDRDRGVIVCLASAAGLTGVARLSDYAASKFAVVGFIESLRAELRLRNSHVRTLLVCPFYVDTGMFAGVRSKVPALLPTMDPHRVACQIADAIEARRQRLVMPWFANLVLLVRALPVPMADRLVDLFGVNHTMDGFTGRTQTRPAREPTRPRE